MKEVKKTYVVCPFSALCFDLSALIIYLASKQNVAILTSLKLSLRRLTLDNEAPCYMGVATFMTVVLNIRIAFISYVSTLAVMILNKSSA